MTMNGQAVLAALAAAGVLASATTAQAQLGVSVSPNVSEMRNVMGQEALRVLASSPAWASMTLGGVTAFEVLTFQVDLDHGVQVWTANGPSRAVAGCAAPVHATFSAESNDQGTITLQLPPAGLGGLTGSVAAGPDQAPLATAWVNAATRGQASTPIRVETAKGVEVNLAQGEGAIVTPTQGSIDLHGVDYVMTARPRMAQVWATAMPQVKTSVDLSQAAARSGGGVGESKYWGRIAGGSLSTINTVRVTPMTPEQFAVACKGATAPVNRLLSAAEAAQFGVRPGTVLAK